MAATKTLASAQAVQSILGTDSIFIEVSGSVRRISVADFVAYLAEALSENQ